MGLFRQKVLFTDEECENIIKTYNYLPSDGSAKNHNFAFRWKNLSKKEDGWILNRIIDWLKSETGHVVEWDNDRNGDEFYFQSYKKGDKFEKHADNMHDRVYTVGLLLNNDFEGGDFLVDVTPNNSSLFKNVIGNCYIIESILNHELKEITNGERHIILIFFKKYQIKFAESLSGLHKLI